MPYLMIMGPEFSLEQRKIMSREITETLLEALQLPATLAHSILVQFLPCPTDHLAVGGRLLSETDERSYFFHFQDMNLTMERKERVLKHLFPLLMELLGLEPSQATQIKMLFESCKPEDFSIGDRFLPELQQAGPSGR